jgi:hypothetical protein
VLAPDYVAHPHPERSAGSELTLLSCRSYARYEQDYTTSTFCASAHLRSGFLSSTRSFRPPSTPHGIFKLPDTMMKHGCEHTHAAAYTEHRRTRLIHCRTTKMAVRSHRISQLVLVMIELNRETRVCCMRANATFDI